MWSKRKAKSKVACFTCKKEILVGEEEWVVFKHKGRIQPDGIDPYYSIVYCLDCGETEKRKEEDEEGKKVKGEADRISLELRQLRNYLEPKVENYDLNENDVKRIYDLKNKINKLLENKIVEDKDNYYWVNIKTKFNIFKKALVDLDNFVKEYASPQTQDKAKDERKGRRKCFHENIEPCTDDPNWYNCSYCWEQNSLEFLQRLKYWQGRSRE
jgi:hypothetical protein